MRVVGHAWGGHAWCGHAWVGLALTEFPAKYDDPYVPTSETKWAGFEIPKDPSPVQPMSRNRL
jgi:hypothetical protein